MAATIVAIGREGFDVVPVATLDHVFGYGVGIDLHAKARAHRTLDRRNVEGQGGRGGPE
jgi:hypothetical protein